jgi:NDP-sugar pyrophosphorylase family protein
MIPVGPKKLPLLAYAIALLKRHGIAKVALLTGYRSEDIESYFGNGSQCGMRLTYSEDKKGVSGSLNAVANALRNGAISKCEELVIYYGDVLVDLNITGLLANHRKSRADVTLVLDRGYSLPVGVAEVNDGRVVSFQEKPNLDMSVTTGTMVAGPRAMAFIRKFASPSRPDLMTDFVPAFLRKGGKVGAFYIQDKWFDVGTVSSFERLNRELEIHPLDYAV